MTTSSKSLSASPADSTGESSSPRAGSGRVRWLWKKPSTLLSALFILLLTSVAVLAPVISPYSPDAQNLMDRLSAPSPKHWLGTDEYGRDALSRLIFGARVSLLAAVQAVSITLIIGLPLGIIAGYVGGWFDTVMNRIMDILMSVPSLVLALTIVAVLGPGITEAMLAIGIVLTPRTFRVARASTLEVRNDTYIEAARAVGASTGRIIVRNILPNVTPPIILVSAVSFGTAVAAEASLSFLGLGVRPPTASWGSMLDNAASTMGIAPLHVWPPGIAIFLTVLAFTYLGEGMREAFIRTRSNGAKS